MWGTPPLWMLRILCDSGGFIESSGGSLLFKHFVSFFRVKLTVALCLIGIGTEDTMEVVDVPAAITAVTAFCCDAQLMRVAVSARL